ncbi:MAG: hypothetical protein ABFC94_02670 [Syntrophomonas sp.]
MLQSIRNMLLSFEEANIIYCHWKSNEHLNDSVNGDTDLDILFRKSQRQEIDIILNKCGLKRFRATYHMQYNAIEDFIGFDKETAKIWHLHVHYQLTLGEKHLKGYTPPWADYILNNRWFSEEFGVFCSQLEDEYFLILLRIALKLRWRDFFKKLGKPEIDEINWLKGYSPDHKVIKSAKILLGERCSKEYEKVLNKKLRNRRDLFKLQRYLRSDMRQFTSYTASKSLIKRTIREGFWFIGGIARRLGLNSTIPSRRISPSGGTVIAILGSDGAGKSTSVAYIKKEFGKKIDLMTIYFGSGDGDSSILRYPMRLIAKRVGGKGLGNSIRKDTNISKSKKNVYFLAKVLWSIALAREKRKKLKMVTKARNNGLLVITDRYPQVEITGYNDGPLLTDYYKGKSRLLRKIAIWEMNIYKSAYVNPPDLVIKLLVPTELAIERKPEMTEFEIENKKTAVRKINLSQNVVEVDTSQNKIISFGNIMEQVWKII